MEIQESVNRVVETATESAFRGNQCVSDRGQTGVGGNSDRTCKATARYTATGECAFTKIEYRQQPVTQ